TQIDLFGTMVKLALALASEDSAYVSKAPPCPVCNKTAGEHTEADYMSCAGKLRKRERRATGLKILGVFREARFKNEEPNPLKRAQLRAQMLQRLCSCGKTLGEHTQDEFRTCSLRRQEGKRGANLEEKKGSGKGNC